MDRLKNWKSLKKITKTLTKIKMKMENIEIKKWFKNE